MRLLWACTVWSLLHFTKAGWISVDGPTQVVTPLQWVGELFLFPESFVRYARFSYTALFRGIEAIPQSAIYLDLARDLFFSPDGRSSWELAKGIRSRSGRTIIQHPFSPSLTFALTTTQTHYRSEDSGKIRENLDVPGDPGLAIWPLSFHSDPQKSGYVLYRASDCRNNICRDVRVLCDCKLPTPPVSLPTAAAHSSTTEIATCCFVSVASLTLITLLQTDYCQAQIFFRSDIVDVLRQDVVNFAIIGKYAVVSVPSPPAHPHEKPRISLYTSTDLATWTQAESQSSEALILYEQGYRLGLSTIDALTVQQRERNALDANLTPSMDAYYDNMGAIQYRRMPGIPGIGLAHVVTNPGPRRRVPNVATHITFDDGRSWGRLRPPVTDYKGRRITCGDTGSQRFVDIASGTRRANGVTFEETFFTTDGGLTWTIISPHRNHAAVANSGSILVLVKDETTTTVEYSRDRMEKLRPRTLHLGTSLPGDLLNGGTDQAMVSISLDFAPALKKCAANAFEDWHATEPNGTCVMGLQMRTQLPIDISLNYMWDVLLEPTRLPPRYIQRTIFALLGRKDVLSEYDQYWDGVECVPFGKELIPNQLCKTLQQITEEETQRRWGLILLLAATSFCILAFWYDNTNGIVGMLMRLVLGVIFLSRTCDALWVWTIKRLGNRDPEDGSQVMYQPLANEDEEDVTEEEDMLQI
ncbi:hypothetical protein B0H17DRAFT_1142358 [Mycena rosella]|uniref:VPS10 domain-containing protein n=1 Tax=Mycena rosella TaxID=1033263 RepID=A0AAD7G580_MYCRO|nr:hypothetical protein B0H17DRAFT_1142358 [Mycena rosella]